MHQLVVGDPGAGTPDIQLPYTTTRGPVVVINESPYGLDFTIGGARVRVPAESFRTLRIPDLQNVVPWSIAYTLSLTGSPLSTLVLELYDCGEEPQAGIVQIMRQMNVGNSLVTNIPANIFEQDLFTPFVYGAQSLAATIDGTFANQLDVAAGVAFLREPDNSVLRIATAATSFLTVTPSTVYYLDLQPDGTWSWGTAHSTQVNYMSIAQITTNGSGNISTVTDKRVFTTTMLPGMGGAIMLGGAGAVGAQLVANSSGFPLGANLASAPVSDTSIITGSVLGDVATRWNAYVRGSDGYGGIRAGKSGITGFTAHLYSQANGWFIDESLGLTGALTKVGGQATAGSFGVPLEVAQALNTHVTAITPQTILSYTPPANGLYRVNVSISMGNPTAEKITLDYQVYDPNQGATVNQYGVAANGLAVGVMAGSATWSVGTYYLFPITAWTGPGGSINVIYTDPGGTPNDFVTVSIERLA